MEMFNRSPEGSTAFRMQGQHGAFLTYYDPTNRSALLFLLLSPWSFFFLGLWFQVVLFLSVFTRCSVCWVRRRAEPCALRKKLRSAMKAFSKSWEKELKEQENAESLGVYFHFCAIFFLLFNLPGFWRA